MLATQLAQQWKDKVFTLLVRVGILLEKDLNIDFLLICLSLYVYLHIYYMYV